MLIIGMQNIPAEFFQFPSKDTKKWEVHFLALNDVRPKLFDLFSFTLPSRPCSLI